MAFGTRGLKAEFKSARFGSAEPTWSSVRPLALLAALFAAELIVISVWLDTDTLSTHSVLLAGIAGFGPRIARGVVGFSAVFVTFAFLKYKMVARRSPIRWRLLGAHFAAMLVFAGLSFLLFSSKLPLAASNAAALGWLAAGMSSIALAALAFMPGGAWMQMVRTTGSLWIYALSAAIALFLAEDLTKLMWQPLSKLTFRLVGALLALFVSPVVLNPATLLIGAPNFEVSVAPACSGFEGMGLILAFGAIWLLLFRKECRFPQALLLLPAGVVFVYLLNVVRITVLILIGSAGAPQVALGGFHSQAGWIAFAAASLAFCFVARRVSWIAARRTDEESTHDPANPTAAYLIPFLAILAAGMVSTALSARFEWLYSLRLIAAAAALFFYRGSYRALDWRFGWRGPAAGGLLFVLWIALDRWSGVASNGAMPPALSTAPAALRAGWIACRAVAAVVTVPIAEELACRGYLLRRLVAADFESVKWRSVSWVALAISSLLFGVMHGPRWAGGTAAGLVYGWLAIRRGRIGEAVAAHAATNALIAIYVVASGQWQLW